METIIFIVILSSLTICGCIIICVQNTRRLQKDIAHSDAYYQNLYTCLQMRMQDEDEENIIKQILRSALLLTQSDTAYLTLHNSSEKYVHNLFAIHRSPINSFKEEMIKNFPIPPQELWRKKTKNQQANCITVTNKTPDNKFDKHSDKISYIICPLIINSNNIGDIALEIHNRKHQWSKTEITWFENLSCIISLLKEQQESHKTKDELYRKTLQSEKRFRLIFDRMPIGAALYNSSAVMIDTNNSLPDIMGIKSREDMIGRCVLDSPTIPHEFKEKIKLGEPISQDVRYDFSLVNRAGHFNSKYDTPRDYHFIFDAVKNAYDEIECYIMLLIDNTDKYATFQKMQKLERLFSYASTQSKVGVGTWNPITNNGFATKEWYWNLGEEESEQLNTKLFNCTHVHPEDRASLLKYAQKINAGQLDSLLMNVRIKAQQGWKWSEQHIILKEFDPQNNNVEVIGINRDINDEKEMESALIQARHKAEESDKLKTAFLMNISHEICTPLNAIVNLSCLLNETETENERERYVSIIERNTDLLLQLFNDIIDLSCMEAETMDFRYTNVDIPELINEIYKQYHRKVSTNVEFVIDSSLPDCLLFTDSVRLRQILTNFISNSIKFTSQGIIKIGYDLRKDNVYFYVNDTGCGISDSNISNIFDRFIKMDKFKQGTGLGLSICKTIVKKLGGHIGVQSKPGIGSTFWFTLPYER